MIFLLEAQKYFIALNSRPVFQLYENCYIHNVASTLFTVVQLDVENDVVSTLFKVVNFNIDVKKVVSTLI